MFMSIVINTMQGTFIVPNEKQADLICWLQTNAIRANQAPVREHFTQGETSYIGRQLITEDQGKEF